MNNGILYLIPTFLAETEPSNVFPLYNAEIVSKLTHFIVEDERTARRFIRKMDRVKDIDSLSLYLLNEHTKQESVKPILEILKAGTDIGLMSEAGSPCIADPGASVVAAAQEIGIRVVPLIGPSSILLALISSGFNGQNFSFNGYIPAEKSKRIAKIRELEKYAYKGQTQIFIETPYRNDHLFKDILATCLPETKLCVAVNLTASNESVLTKTIGAWKSSPMPDIRKIPTVFLIYK